MKRLFQQMIREAAARAHQAGALPSDDLPDVIIEEPRAEAHGDFATTVAMNMARSQKMAPRRIAEVLVNHLRDPQELLDKTEIAGPGFINFFLRPAAWHPILNHIHRLGRHYGASQLGAGQKVQVEFVSANPTGPLHVGHGRGAAVGDSVANLLAFNGFDVQREYYINDSGRQIRTLGLSVYLRYQELAGRPVAFPEDCYQGAYIRELAQAMRTEHGDALLSISEDEAIERCARHSAQRILGQIRADLNAFGVSFDNWFSEQSLFDAGKVEQALGDFLDSDLIYIQDGAQWFRTSRFGDEKDRVVVRQNGQTTYFAADLAYHQDKFARGFDRVIDVWGADHHGYIPRMAATIEASGRERRQFAVILVQLVNLLRKGEPVAMSTRAGEFVTLKEVVDEVGRDAARFIFLTRHYESPLDFDLEVAKQKTNDNPVYYVQYVHARIASIMRVAGERGVALNQGPDTPLQRLAAPEELQLVKLLGRYPEIVQQSALQLEPHRITYCLMDLAAAFHAYYNKHRVLSDDAELTSARLYLVQAVKEVIRNGLTLLGVDAPEAM